MQSIRSSITFSLVLAASCIPRAERGPDPEPFLFRRTELELVFPTDLRDPIEARLIATIAFDPVSPRESWLSETPLFSFDESAVIKRALDGGGNALELKHRAFSRGGRRLVSLERDFTVGPEHVVILEYTVQPEASPYIGVRSEKTLLAFSGAEIAPRIQNYRYEACPRTIRVLWKTGEHRAVLAGPGGAVPLAPAPGGGLQGEIRTPEGEVGANDFIVSALERVVESGPVSVFATASSRVPETHESVAAAIARVAALYESRLGPLDRPIAAVEAGVKGWSLYSGVFVLPSAVFERHNLYVDQLIAHELAHSYFGDDVFSSGPGGAFIVEGAAEYLSLVAVEELRGSQDLRAVLFDYREAARTEPTLPAPLRMYPGSAPLPSMGYVRSAYFFRMLEARIGREEVLAFLSRTWRENRWSEWPLERLTGDARLRKLWEQEGRGPAWPEFIACWLGEPSSMPRIAFRSGITRPAGSAFQATVVLENTGDCAADVPVEFRGAGGESLTRWVYVDREATLSVSVYWRPVAAVLDSQLFVFEAATEQRTLRLESSRSTFPAPRGSAPPRASPSGSRRPGTGSSPPPRGRS